MESYKSKKQKTDENEEVEVDNEAELKKHMVIVKDDDIAIYAIPLATKRPMIIEYKLIKEGIIGHYQLIRADGSSKRFSFYVLLVQKVYAVGLQLLEELLLSKDNKKSKTSRHVKRGRDTKIPQSSGPPIKFGDEVVHKELGDRIERAATTASSLEAEQDSGNNNNTQSMATLNGLSP
ncbi:hypothetical protein Tco_0459504 [Tanacetum coccineum]